MTYSDTSLEDKQSMREDVTNKLLATTDKMEEAACLQVLERIQEKIVLDLTEIKDLEILFFGDTTAAVSSIGEHYDNEINEEICMGCEITERLSSLAGQDQ